MTRRFELGLCGRIVMIFALVACGTGGDAEPVDPATAPPETAPESVEARGAELQSAVAEGTSTPLPRPRDGVDVLGARLPNGVDRALDESGDPPRATLYRWWTDRCPFCVASLPAIEELRLAYADRGLETVAVFHPKPPIDPATLGEVPLATLREVAAARGYHGRVAADMDWSHLRELWLDSGARRATSASFLVDEEGVVRFVHPGPEVHRSADPDHELCNSDFEALEQAIEALLAQ